MTNGKRNDQSDWIVTKNAHPAIIDEKLWSAAQASLQARKQSK